MTALKHRQSQAISTRIALPPSLPAPTPPDLYDQGVSVSDAKVPPCLTLTYDTPKSAHHCAVPNMTGNWSSGWRFTAQVNVDAKLFSAASTKNSRAEPKQQRFLGGCAMPGMLPTINGILCRQACRTGLGLKGRDSTWHSAFDRKELLLTPIYRRLSGFRSLVPPHCGRRRMLVEMAGRGSAGENPTRGLRACGTHSPGTDAGKSIHDMPEHVLLLDLNRTGCRR